MKPRNRTRRCARDRTANTARRATRAATPIEMAEYYRIVDLWADAALQLREQDLKLMQRLANAQARQATLAKAS